MYSNRRLTYLFLVSLFLFSCSTQKKLAYLDNLTETEAEGNFVTVIPDYLLQPRDILYITIKAMTPDGTIKDFLVSGNSQTTSFGQAESGGYLYGYNVDSDGNIVIPVIGEVKVIGLTLESARKLLQEKSEHVFKDATVECKLLSFKFTVIGEVHSPGSYVNYNNYLTVLEAIGRAGGIGDFGRRDKILVVRSVAGGVKTYSLNLQDKNLLSNAAYFLLPNDVVIIEAQPKKIFNLNLPTFSFIFSSVTSAVTVTLLLINYFGK